MAGSQIRLFSHSELVDDDQPARGPLGLGMNQWHDFNLFCNSPGYVGVNDFSQWLVMGMGALARVAGSASRSTTTAAAPTLTPVEFADEYRNVRVSHEDSRSGLVRSVNVDVHIYNNNGLANHRANMREKNKLVGELRKELQRANGLGLIGVDIQHKFSIAKAFYGKGFPEDFALVFKYALRYGRATLSGLDHYCDYTAKLGVDCSGFVNAYFLRTGKITEAKLISSYGRGPLRASADDIQDLDVLVWHDSSHIAVIDHVIADTDPIKLKVVESAKSKHGLAVSDYTVLSQRNDMFYVDRGGAGGRPSRVKIVEVT